MTELLGVDQALPGFWIYHSETEVSIRYPGPIEIPSDITPEILMYWTVKHVMLVEEDDYLEVDKLDAYVH